MEEQARIAEEKRQEEAATAFAQAEAERMEREAREAAAEQAAKVAAAQVAYQQQLVEQAAYEEEERVKREELLRFAAVQDRMQAKLEMRQVPQVAQPQASSSLDSLTALKERLASSIPKLDFKPSDTASSLLNKLHPDSTGGDTGHTLFHVINENGVCVMPMLSFEVAVLALSIFLSDLDFAVADFLKLTEKFFGIFIALIGAVSVATPGGELVMLCCVHQVNDLVLRSWFMLFMLVLCVRAVFENTPDRHERWLRLLQVACTLFVADCFVLHQHVCHDEPPQVHATSSGDNMRNSAMYIWAGCIFFLVFKIEEYLDGGDSNTGDKWKRWNTQVPSRGRYRFDSDNSVDICDVDDDEEENGYKSKSK